MAGASVTTPGAQPTGCTQTVYEPEATPPVVNTRPVSSSRYLPVTGGVQETVDRVVNPVTMQLSSLARSCVQSGVQRRSIVSKVAVAAGHCDGHVEMTYVRPATRSSSYVFEGHAAVVTPLAHEQAPRTGNGTAAGVQQLSQIAATLRYARV